MQSIFNDTLKGSIGSWRLYLLYVAVSAPVLIINQVVVTIVTGYTSPSPAQIPLLLSAYCCMVLFLLLYMVFVIISAPFYTAGFAGSILEAFSDAPVTVKKMWQTGKKYYWHSMGVFGLYIATFIPIVVLFIIVILAVIFSGQISEAELMTGTYLYTNPIILAVTFFVYLSSSFIVVWYIAANSALAAGAEKLSRAAKTPFSIVARFPAHTIVFVILYLLYSLVNVILNLALPHYVPYSEWGVLLINVFLVPAIYLLMVSYLTALAVRYFSATGETV